MNRPPLCVTKSRNGSVRAVFVNKLKPAHATRSPIKASAEAVTGNADLTEDSDDA
jgi:hypothetical protein